MALISMPLSSRWVAKVCLSWCGLMVLSMPAFFVILLMALLISTSGLPVTGDGKTSGFAFEP